jgi:hypothetical protein
MVEGETCIVKLPSGPTSFQSTVVKSYLQLESIKSDLEIDLKPQESKVDRTMLIGQVPTTNIH